MQYLLTETRSALPSELALRQTDRQTDLGFMYGRSRFESPSQHLSIGTEDFRGFPKRLCITPEQAG